MTVTSEKERKKKWILIRHPSLCADADRSAGNLLLLELNSVQSVSDIISVMPGDMNNVREGFFHHRQVKNGMMIKQEEERFCSSVNGV